MLFNIICKVIIRYKNVKCEVGLQLLPKIYFNLPIKFFLIKFQWFSDLLKDITVPK